MRYQEVNGSWPKGLPQLTHIEAERATRRLWSHFYSPKYEPRIRVRRVWVSAKNKDNLHGGWRRLVHDVSHMVNRRRYPSKRPHDPTQERLELEMTRYVLEKDWLNGSLKPKERVKEPKTALREARARANLRKAETRLKRAQTLHKKWKKTVAYYYKKAAAE